MKTYVWGDKMDEVTFVQCGDIHLDARFTGTGMADQKARQRRQELRDVFSRIIGEVIERRAQLFFICGDLFEHEYVGRQTIQFIIHEFERIPGVNVFITPGNHDPYVGNSYYMTMNWPANVHIFTGKMEYVALPEYQVIICGAGFEGRYQYHSLIDQTLLPSGENCKPGFTKILVIHGTVVSSMCECQYHPITVEDIERGGYAYAALGHIHKHTGYKNNRILYCGSPESLGFDEPGEHGIIVGKITPDGVKTDFIKMNQRTCMIKKIDITNDVGTEAVENHIREQLEGCGNEIVKVVVTGKIPDEFKPDFETMTARLEQCCFYLRLVDETGPDYNIEELCRENNVKGIFVRKIMEQIEKTDGEQDRQKLYKALYLGLDALDDRELEI